MRNFYILIGPILWALSLSVSAEVLPYESIDNTGLNKQERIETIDKYLVTLVASIKKMESKLDENSKKLKSLDDIIKGIKETEQKNTESQLGEKKTTPLLATKDTNEIEKLKADILSLKNQDIERIKIDFQELRDTVKALQATIKDQMK
jgi:predicted  nucleic acid-binding Zn-ribbon protein